MAASIFSGDAKSSLTVPGDTLSTLTVLVISTVKCICVQTDRLVINTTLIITLGAMGVFAAPLCYRLTPFVAATFPQCGTVAIITALSGYAGVAVAAKPHLEAG